MTPATKQLEAQLEAPSAAPRAAERLARTLRAVGVAFVVISGVSFLLEGWTVTHVLIRQLAFSVVTLLLVAFGIVAARRLQDRAGARIALGLAAATVPLLVGPALFTGRGAHLPILTVNPSDDKAASLREEDGYGYLA